MATAKSADTKGKSAAKATTGKSGTAKTAASRSSGKTATIVSKTAAKTPAKTGTAKTTTTAEKAMPRKTEPKAANLVKEAAPAVKKGDCIKFGSYYQENGSKKSPIEWLVLEKKGDELLLISRYGLDCKQYHHECVDMTWEKCDLRKWLNNDFLKAAFTAEERKKIKVSSLTNEDNPQYQTKGGNATKDQIFCLSLAEAKKYFKDDAARQCKATKYAVSNHCWVNPNASKKGYGYSWWWLRSPGYYQSSASHVFAVGALCPFGNCVSSDSGAVRPALRIIWNR